MKNLKVYRGLLLVVDMVNGFTKYGDLHDKVINKIVPRQIELINDAKAKGDLIVFIKDTHEKKSREHKRFNGLVHCIKGSGEEELIDELKPYENDDTIEIEKNSTCFMEAPKFRKIIRELENLKRVNIVGCCTDICVFNGAMGLANYFDEWNIDADIYVHTDAIATFAQDVRQNYIDAAYLLMEQQGIQLVKKVGGK